MTDQHSQHSQDMPDLPEGIVIPDSPEGLLTPRFYRKQAQQAMILALHDSAGRSGLSAEEKIDQIKKMKAHLDEALSAATLALATMENPTDESE